MHHFQIEVWLRIGILFSEKVAKYGPQGKVIFYGVLVSFGNAIFCYHALESIIGA